MQMAELLRARADIDRIEKTKQRDITDNELYPLLHNVRVESKDLENELRENYKEKFPTYLNKEDLDSLAIMIVQIEIIDRLMFEWLAFKRPKKAIKYIKSARTFLIKAITEFTEQLPKEEKIKLIRKATKLVDESRGR